VSEGQKVPPQNLNPQGRDSIRPPGGVRTPRAVLVSFVRDALRLIDQSQVSLIDLENLQKAAAGWEQSRELWVSLFGSIHALRGMSSLIPEGQSLAQSLEPIEQEILGLLHSGVDSFSQDRSTLEHFKEIIRSSQHHVLSLNTTIGDFSFSGPDSGPSSGGRSNVGTIAPSGWIRVLTSTGEVLLPLKWVLRMEARLDALTFSAPGSETESFVLTGGHWVPAQNRGDSGEVGVWVCLGRMGRPEKWLGGIKILGMVRARGENLTSSSGASDQGEQELEQWLGS